jgi:hypothetical protein
MYQVLHDEVSNLLIEDDLYFKFHKVDDETERTKYGITTP